MGEGITPRNPRKAFTGDEVRVIIRAVPERIIHFAA